MTAGFPAPAAVITRGWTGLVKRAGHAGPALLAELLLKCWRGEKRIAISADTVKIVMTDWTQAVVTLADVDLLGLLGNPHSTIEKWPSRVHSIPANAGDAWTESEVKNEVKQKQQKAGDAKDCPSANQCMGERNLR